MIYLMLQAYAAVRMLTTPTLRLATCAELGGSQRAASVLRHPGIVMLNRVLLEPSECETTTEEELVAWLGPKDPRTVHVRDHIGVQSGGTLRAGLLDGGTTDDARLEWVPGEGEAEDELALKLALGPAQPLVRPVAQHDRPRIDVLLAMPRPLVFARLLPMMSQIGVDRIWITGARRVDKSYFASHLLRPDRADDLRAALVDGLEQSGDTAVPRFELRRSLSKLLASDDLFAPRGTTTDSTAASSAADAADAAPLIKLVCHPERRDGDEGVRQPTLIGQALADVPPNARVVLAVGPERGWAEPDELDLFESHGFRTVTLGPRTLRTDVALVSLLAVAHERLEESKQRG